MLAVSLIAALDFVYTGWCKSTTHSSANWSEAFRCAGPVSRECRGLHVAVSGDSETLELSYFDASPGC